VSTRGIRARGINKLVHQVPHSEWQGLAHSYNNHFLWRWVGWGWGGGGNSEVVPRPDETNSECLHVSGTSHTCTLSVPLWHITLRVHAQQGLGNLSRLDHRFM
jgi:hypothetical protein